MKFTLEKVLVDLKKEFESLSDKEWSESGDVNLIDQGGVKYRRSDDGIEAILYHGLDNIPDGVENEKHGYFDLEELTAQIDKIWSFSDVENCGLDIGFLIQSLDQYCGIF